MDSQRQLIIKHLDEKMQKFRSATESNAPPNGWIRAIRTALKIPRRSIAKRLGISEPTLMGIEEREVEGTVSLKILRQAAAAMDLTLVYGFVPKDGSLKAAIRKKAIEAATKIVVRTAHSMALEDQAISDRRIKDAIKMKARELEDRLPSFLWE